MGFDDYNKGHMGRGGTQWGNEDWEAGNRRRMVEEQQKAAQRYNEELAARQRQEREQNQKRQADFARFQAEQQRLASAAVFKPSPPWSPSASTQGAYGSGSAGGSYSGGNGYAYGSGPSSSTLGAIVTAPFRLAWAAIKLLVKVALALILVAVVVAVLANEKSKNERASSAPAVATNRVSAPPTAAYAPAIATTPAARVAWMGLRGEDLTEESRFALRLNQGVGARVTEVMTGSPAERAGIEEGDILLSISGALIRRWDDVPLQVQHHAIGQALPVEVFRYGRFLKIQVELAARPL